MYFLPLVIQLISLLVQNGSQVHTLSQMQNIEHFEHIKFINKNASDWKSVVNNRQHTSLKPNTAYLTTYNQQLHIDLISLEKYFSMVLLPSVRFPVLSIRSNRTEQNVTCYTGYLRNSPFDSQLFAYFHNQVLNAIIFAFNEIYHLEELDNQTVIMYKESDLNLSDYKFFDLKTQLGSSNNTNFDVDKHSAGKQTNELPVFSKRKLFNFNSNKETLYPDQPSICDVELLSDHTFTQYYNHDTVRISSELFLMLMKANSIYTKADFNSDGRAGDVSLQLARIVIFHSENEKGYTWSDLNLGPEQVLNQFGLRLQTHCIAISLLNRDYEWFSERPGTLGISWIPKPNSIAFGICSRPVLNKQVSLNQLFIGNTGIVTNVNYGKIRSRAEVSLTLTHEISHLFGSNHDDAEEVQKEYGSCGKNYLMSEFDSSTLNVSTKEEFSYCSLKQIDRILRIKSTCFRPYLPFCGNGIRELGEECDCGPRITCSIIDPCCRPDCLLKPECKYSSFNSRIDYDLPNKLSLDRTANNFLISSNYPQPFNLFKPLQPFRQPLISNQALLPFRPFYFNPRPYPTLIKNSPPFQPFNRPIHPMIPDLFKPRKYRLPFRQPLINTRLQPTGELNRNKAFYPRLINEKLDRSNSKSNRKSDEEYNLNNVLKDAGSKERNGSTNLLSVNKSERKFLSFRKLFILIPIGFAICFLIVPAWCSQESKDYRHRRRRKARRRLNRYTSY